MKAYITLEDKFKIICRVCGSEEVYLGVDECEECGNTVSADCNKCHAKFRYHDFEPNPEFLNESKKKKL